MNSSPRALPLDDRLRAAAFASLLLLCVAGADGAVCYIASTVTIVASELTRKLTFIRVQSVWALSFLYNVCREGYFDRDNVVREFGMGTYDRAAQYVCAANAATLLVWTLFFRAPLNEPDEAPPAKRTPFTNTTLIVAYAVSVAMMIPAAITGFQSGREGAMVSPKDIVTNTPIAVLFEIVNNVSTALPALLVYHLRLVRRSSWTLVFAACMPLLALVVVLGTRYFLLFSVVGAVVVALSQYKLRPRVLVGLTAMTIVAFVFSAIMVGARQKGFASFKLSDLSARPGALGFHYEGVIPTLSLLMAYCDRFGYMYGRSSGGILIFWVPRFMWPDKPTLMGYWLPRETGVTHGFSGGYSVSATFAADAYADFGFIGGLLVCALLGFLFAKLETWAAVTLARRKSVMVALAALLYAAAFFAVRSLDTTFIIVCGFFAIILGFRFLYAIDANANVRAEQLLRGAYRSRARR